MVAALCCRTAGARPTVLGGTTTKCNEQHRGVSRGDCMLLSVYGVHKDTSSSRGEPETFLT